MSFSHAAVASAMTSPAWSAIQPDLVPKEQWEARYDLINAWEAEQVAKGVTFVKVFLHISYDEQRKSWSPNDTHDPKDSTLTWRPLRPRRR